MTRVFRRFSSMPTAVGSAFLALSGLAALGCGGKGERQKANSTVTAALDAGTAVDPCKLSESLEISQFGCTPGKRVVVGSDTTISKCLDWEGVVDAKGDPPGAAPSGGFVYTDAIALSAANQGAHDVQPVVVPNTLTYARMPVGEEHCVQEGKKDLFAFHLYSTGQDIWGPQFGVKFTSASDGPLPPVDVSSYDGFGFWIKKGTDHPELEPTGSTLFVSLGDAQTTSSDSDDVPPCNDKSNFDYRKCDQFGKAIGFDATWRFVMIPIDELKQRGYGVYSASLDEKRINLIKFSMDIGDAANGNWNVWVDDVVLYKYKTGGDAGTP